MRRWRMPSARTAAIKAVVDAWVVPGPDPAEHQAWKDRLHQTSPDGWPVLADAVERLVAVEQERSLGKASR